MERIQLAFYGFCALVILGLISMGIIGQFVSHDYNVTVIDKVVKTSKEHSKYLVFTETDNGTTRVFQDTDSLFRGKFNSSDIYGDIKIGKKYHVAAYGFRIPFLSMYENITELKPVKQ